MFSRSLIDSYLVKSGSISDDSGAMIQLTASFAVIIYVNHIFIVRATEI
jgi:hypothetical protein